MLLWFREENERDEEEAESCSPSSGQGERSQPG